MRDKGDPLVFFAFSMVNLVEAVPYLAVHMIKHQFIIINMMPMTLYEPMTMMMIIMMMIIWSAIHHLSLMGVRAKTLEK
jgi:hypothetical protein